MTKQVEQFIYSYTENVMQLLFNNVGIIYEINFNNSGSEANYYSEVEIEIWKGSSVEYIYSIIIFISGKEQGNKEELIKEFLYDLFKHFLKDAGAPDRTKKEIDRDYNTNN